MRFGIRRFSFRKRIAARTSVKRYVRHSLGVKAPRGWGWLTNPRKAAYNRVYNRTTISADKVVGLVLVALGALAVAVYRLFQNAIQNRRWGWLVFMGFIGVGLVLLFVPSQKSRIAAPVEPRAFQPLTSVSMSKAEPVQQQVSAAYKIPRACIVRSRPEIMGTAINTVVAGAGVGVLQVKSGWRRVRLPSGIEGWTGPKCWLPTVHTGNACASHGDCESERCLDGTCR